MIIVKFILYYNFNFLINKLNNEYFYYLFLNKYMIKDYPTKSNINISLNDIHLFKNSTDPLISIFFLKLAVYLFSISPFFLMTTSIFPCL